jgi:hypothetical protein
VTDALNKCIYCLSVINTIGQLVAVQIQDLFLISCTNTGSIPYQQSASQILVHTDSSRTVESFWIQTCILRDLHRQTSCRPVQCIWRARTFPVTIPANTGLFSYSSYSSFSSVAKLRKETVNFVMSTVREHRNTWPPIGRILMKFYISVFRKSVEKIPSFIKICQE